MGLLNGLSNTKDVKKMRILKTKYIWTQTWVNITIKNLKTRLKGISSMFSQHKVQLRLMKWMTKILKSSINQTKVKRMIKMYWLVSLMLNLLGKSKIHKRICMRPWVISCLMKHINLKIHPTRIRKKELLRGQILQEIIRSE